MSDPQFLQVVAILLTIVEEAHLAWFWCAVLMFLVVVADKTHEEQTQSDAKLKEKKYEFCLLEKH